MFCVRTGLVQRGVFNHFAYDSIFQLHRVLGALASEGKRNNQSSVRQKVVFAPCASGVFSIHGTHFEVPCSILNERRKKCSITFEDWLRKFKRLRIKMPLLKARNQKVNK